VRWQSRMMAALLGAVGVGFGLTSSVALADTFTLNLSLASSGTVGQPIAVTAGGSDPTDEGALYLEIDAIPTTVTTACPTGYLNGSQLAASSGGTLVAFDQPEAFDASGNFSNVNAFTPQTASSFLICGYTDDGAGDTLASATMTTTITSVSRPVNTTRPRVTRSGDTLSCSVGRWQNAPVNYSYRWLVAHKVKNGAHGRTLRSARKLRGRSVQCSVTASNSAGSATATSAAVKVH
jgi:hypothetical protein